VRDGRSEPLTLGDDANFSMRIDPAPSVDAPLVFAGYGLRIPELNIDELAGLDLKGAVVVHISATPRSIPGPLQAHFGSSAERWKMYRAAGAIGTITISNPKTIHTFADLLAQVDADKPVPHFVLPARVKATVQFHQVGHPGAGDESGLRAELPIGSFLRTYRQIVAVAPLFPRAIIVPQLVVADQVQREQIYRRAHADLAVRDHLLRGEDAAVLVQLLDLVGRFERLRLRIEQILPINRH